MVFCLHFILGDVWANGYMIYEPIDQWGYIFFIQLAVELFLMSPYKCAF